MAQNDKFLKQPYLLLNTFLFILLVNYSYCRAENIYYKDGNTVKEKIIYRRNNTIWVKNSFGAVGIDSKNIDRIENDDGSISKYDVASFVKLIQKFIKQKSYKEAEKICTMLLETSPDNIDIHYLRGMLNQRNGDKDKASEDYSFLINHKDADEGVFNNLGTIYAQRKSYKEAEELFYEAIRSRPDKAEFRNNLSELLMQMKEYDRAIEEYKILIKLEPDNISALYNLGIAYKNKGDDVLAKEQWEKILVLQPEHNDAKNALEYLERQKQ